MHFLIALFFLSIFEFCTQVSAASLPEPPLVTQENLLKHNTLIIYSGHSSVPSHIKIREGFQERLKLSKPENEHIEVYEEYIDDYRLNITREKLDTYFIDLWNAKYANVKMDMVVTVGPTADNLLIRHPEFFADAPHYQVRASGLSNTIQHTTNNPNNILRLFDVISTVLPNTERLIVVMPDKSNRYPSKLIDDFEAIQRFFSPKAAIEIWNDFSFDELYNRSKQLPEKTAMLYFPVGVDKLGQRKLPVDVIKQLAQVASVPIFVHDDTYLGLGVVGGYLRNIKQEGDIIGRLILGLKVPTSVEEYDAEVRGYFFDYKALKRWHILKKNLPPNSTVINRPESPLYVYRWYILMAFAILVETLLIMMLIRSVQRSKKLTLELAQERNLLEERVKERTSELEESQLLFQDAVSVAKLGVFSYDLMTSELHWDDSMYSIYGIDPKNRDLAYEVWQHAVLPEDLLKAEYELHAAIEEHKAFDTRFRIRRPDGKIRTVQALAQFYRDENGEPLRLVGINQDVTEREEAEAIIHNFAYFDALTQLPNRRMLTEQLKHAISFSHREQKQFAVMVMDLDKFKPVNDTLGHRAGDELLIQVATRIKVRLREHDTVARLGGDEFVVLLTNIHSLDDTTRVANALIETLSQPFVLAQSDNVQIGTSIGIALYPQHGIDADELIDKADIALYRAKHNGRGCFAYYEENEV